MCPSVAQHAGSAGQLAPVPADGVSKRGVQMLLDGTRMHYSYRQYRPQPEPAQSTIRAHNARSDLQWNSACFTHRGLQTRIGTDPQTKRVAQETDAGELS